MAKRLSAMDQVWVTQEMKAKAERYPTCGYRKIAAMLRLDGWAVTETQVKRLWRLAGMKAQL
jgi:hypothetical protein